ncbi:hypothetical protein [Flavobacterium hungaricum]|uniref:Uncharacterized protein n=1 Tax=Flavobacterium hungaricum TaxID=2082725 RepID=A0ABR9TJC4_9FLAO|nr:hypothetical protein [Flavobacterium hungaricum]MBE8725365.1 hypothetical protein [Flavobacterium hungaricum]
MRIILIVIGVIVLAILFFAIYRYIVVSIQNKKLNEIRLGRIKPIYEKLSNGLEVTKEDVFPFASDLLTRQITFQLLKEYKKLELFPDVFNTIEKGAETDLANWLEFPTELDACPDEIELEEKVTIDFDGNNVFYYVFKFKTYEPHWASKNDWMLGVVGPYFDDSTPYDFTTVFSRLSSKYGEISAHEEAKWVHENIAGPR